MEALMQDLGQQTKKGGIFNSVVDALGWDSDIPGPSEKYQLFTDKVTWSIAGSETITPASNIQSQINLRQQNCVIDTHKTYLVGHFACPTGIINTHQGFKSLFQILEMQLGDGVNIPYAFSHYYNAMKHVIKKKSTKQDRAEGSLFSSYDAQCPIAVIETGASQSAPTDIWSGTGGGANGAVNPYIIAMRKNIQAFKMQSHGEFITVSNGQQGGAAANVQCQTVKFAVPLSELSDFFHENRYLFLGMGQTLRIVMKTTDKSECVTQVYGGNNFIASDYTLSNLGVFVTWIPVAEQGHDLHNILKSRVLMKYERQIPYTLPSAQVTGTLNLQFSLAPKDRLRNITLGFFSAMQVSGDGLIGTLNQIPLDNTNTPANIIPNPDALRIEYTQSQYQTAQMHYFPQPAISQIVIQSGASQVVLNTQQIKFLDLRWANRVPNVHSHDPIWSAIMNPLFIDLTRYGTELDLEGSSSGGSTSLLVQITLDPGTGVGADGSNLTRTMPYQQADWTYGRTKGLKVYAFANVLNECELVNGVYMP